MSDSYRRRSNAGFTLMELLVTIVLAGIIFGAVVPLFLNVLKATARDARRNDAELIAQDRVEQARLLPYNELSQTNLRNGTANDGSQLGDGRFGGTYTLTGQRPYHVDYYVTHVIDPSAEATDTDYNKVKITVTAHDGSTASVTTTVKNPAPGLISVDTGGGGGPLPTTNLSITVSFKNWADVVQSSSKGVFWTRTPTGGGSSVTSTHVWPTSASNSTVTFTGLTGGKDYTYTVTVYSSKWQSGNSPFTSPPFHLLKSARLKFDTNPGGS